MPIENPNSEFNRSNVTADIEDMITSLLVSFFLSEIKPGNLSESRDFSVFHQSEPTKSGNNPIAPGYFERSR